MTSEDTIATFFTKISQLKDQLVSISENVEADDLVHKVIDALPPTWEAFDAGACASEKQPYFKRF
jgi:hypothetical protein